MRLRSDITINGRKYKKGDYVSPWFIYPFFLVHMGLFGLAGFVMAYSDNAAPVKFLYLHGGFAILIYLIFYLTIFGRDSVKWMFINAALGIFGLYTQLDWILALFGRTVDDYPWNVHAIPMLYFIMYTFLLRQALIDFSGAREDYNKQTVVDWIFVIGSFLFYLWI